MAVLPPSVATTTACWITPLGSIQAEACDAGLVRLHFIEEAVPVETTSDPATGHPILQQTARELREYFNRKRRRFEVPLKPEGTPFDLKVWKALLDVPYGTTRSYGEQAGLLGDIKAIRAVAAANGRNPIAILIPCHRILGAGGKLTGYRGGLWRKQALLDQEQPGLFG